MDDDPLTPKHKPNCFVYTDGPCDCGVESYTSDEDIDAEMLDKEAANG